jgi:hypothetical protein
MSLKPPSTKMASLTLGILNGRSKPRIRSPSFYKVKPVEYKESFVEWLTEYAEKEEFRDNFLKTAPLLASSLAIDSGGSLASLKEDVEKRSNKLWDQFEVKVAAIAGEPREVLSAEHPERKELKQKLQDRHPETVERFGWIE